MAEPGQHDQSGAPTRCRRKRGAQAEAIGHSRGGPSTKVHLIVDALGLPLAFDITEGQRHDIVPAPQLVERTKPSCLIADRGYDSAQFRADLERQNCVPVIPTRACTTKQPYDKDLYRARCEVECTFNLLKQARRFATRYEKTRRNYVAVVALGCALLWLRI